MSYVIACRNPSSKKLFFIMDGEGPDELAEFVAVYAKVNKVTPKNVKKKLSAQVKKGLAQAFAKFDEYQFAKYNRDGDVKLRDVMFLCHPKPAIGRAGVPSTHPSKPKSMKPSTMPGSTTGYPGSRKSSLLSNGTSRSAGT